MIPKITNVSHKGLIKSTKDSETTYLNVSAFPIAKTGDWCIHKEIGKTSEHIWYSRNHWNFSYNDSITFFDPSGKGYNVKINQEQYEMLIKDKTAIVEADIVEAPIYKTDTRQSTSPW